MVSELEEVIIQKRHFHRQKGITYNVTSADNPFPGYVTVDFQDLGAVDQPELQKQAMALGLDLYAAIAEISHFFPNGKPPNEKDILPYMRKGVGSLALETILRDAARYGNLLVYCVTPKDEMAAFLRKKSFTEFNGTEPWAYYFYKLL